MDSSNQTDHLLLDNLFRKYYKILKAFACKYVEDQSIAEDIVQEVFYEIWLRKSMIDLNAYLKPYLFKSVHNKCLNHLNNKYTKEKISLNQLSTDSYSEPSLKSQESELEDSLLYKELESEIRKCIDNLPEQCKKTYLLRHTYGLKNREIAEQLNINIKTVEKHMANALIKIREHLKKLDLLPGIISLIVKIFLMR